MGILMPAVMVILLEEKALKLLINMGADEEISSSYMDLGIAYVNLNEYQVIISRYQIIINCGMNIVCLEC